ncbi:MAG: phosphotransferase family protein [Actinomycetota bacterium]
MDPATILAIDIAIRPSLPGSDRAQVAVLLDVGFSSTVVRIGGTVARIARNDDAAGGHRRQAALLPAVAARLSIAVPSDLRLLPPSPELPFGALLASYIPGRPMERADAERNPTAVARIATVLTEIHGVPWRALPPGSLGSFEPVSELRRLRAETDAELVRRLDVVERRVFDRRWQEAIEVLPNGPTMFCHGDPWFGNFLVDEEGRPAALLDFEDACTGDPAMDLAAVFHLPRPVADDIVVRYVATQAVDASLPVRIELHRMIREVAGLSYVLRNAQGDEVDQTVGRLRDLLRETR